MERISGMDDNKSEQYKLLTRRERRLARKIVVTSINTIYAQGGYGKSQFSLHPTPWSAIIISAAGAQFEMDYLEAQDFIVEAGQSRDYNCLPYYKEYKPAYNEINPNDYDNIIRIGADYFMKNIYREAIAGDILLMCKAFSSYVDQGNGWLRLTALGMGFFADYYKTHNNIKDILLPLFIEALVSVVPKIPSNIRVIEIHDFFNGGFWFTGVNSDRIKMGNVIFVHSKYVDVLSYPTQAIEKGYIIGLINAGDAFAWKGNEFTSQSVEAMIGNDTDLRVTQVIARNDYFKPTTVLGLDI